MVSLLPTSWNGRNSGRVEEAPAAQRVGGEEVAELLAAEAEGGFLADRAEGAVLRGEAAEGLLAESGTRDGVDHQAGLVAELRARRAGDQFHRLDGVERNLRGELLALLIGDRLAVDREAGLRVIAQRVEEAVGIGHHAGAGHRDRVAQSAARGGGGQLRIELAIHVVVRVGDVFEHRGAARFHRDGGVFAGQREREFERHRNAGAHRHVLRAHREAGGGDRNLVGIRRDVEEVERAGSVRERGAVVAGESGC